MLLAGCEDFSVSNDKPIFTISNMPSVAQQETTQINNVQPEIQSEETGRSEVEQGAPISAVSYTHLKLPTKRIV